MLRPVLLLDLDDVRQAEAKLLPLNFRGLAVLLAVARRLSRWRLLLLLRKTQSQLANEWSRRRRFEVIIDLDSNLHAVAWLGTDWRAPLRREDTVPEN